MSVVVNIGCVSQFLAACKGSKLSYLSKSVEKTWRGGRGCVGGDSDGEEADTQRTGCCVA